VQTEKRSRKLAERAEKERQRELMTTLAELGGQGVTEEDVVFQGTKLILPETMSERTAIQFLQRKLELEEESMDFNRTYRYRPLDGAMATYRALKRAFGFVGQEPTWTFWGKEPPHMITIKTGPDVEEQVPWGKLTVPLMPGAFINVGAAEDEEWGDCFRLSIMAPRKFRYHCEGIFKLVDEELAKNSIYRGQAIDGSFEFLDLRGVDLDKIIYGEETTTQLQANLWSVLEYAPALRKVGITRKRAVLLYGPYGTGKTLAGYYTAVKAVDNGWSFLFARPGKDNLLAVMQTARMYQPSVVFFEDVETIADTDRTKDMVSNLLDVFDGITSKGSEIVVVLTTNHEKRIHKGMMRPGRLDAVVEIGLLDAGSVARLVYATLPEGSLDTDIDWDAVNDAASGMTPAYIKEIADRTFRYALARNRGNLDGIKVSTADLVSAAKGLVPQLRLMEGADEKVRGTTMEDLIADQVQVSVVDIFERPEALYIKKDAVRKARAAKTLPH
jgi:transitional endoplasmic reticulum ATPase